MSEDDLKAAVIELAHLFGLMVAHFRPAKTERGWRTAVEADGKGYPDMTIVGPGGVMFRELKSAHGTCSPEQAIWIGRLASAGANAGVWRPRDLKSGLIERELRALKSAAQVTFADRKPTAKPAWMK